MPTETPSTDFNKKPNFMVISILFVVLVAVLGYMVAAIHCEPGQSVFQAYNSLPLFWKTGVPCMVAGAILGPLARRNLRRHDEKNASIARQKCENHFAKRPVPRTSSFRLVFAIVLDHRKSTDLVYRVCQLDSHRVH